MALAALVSGPALATDKTDVVAVIQHFADGFNQGDVAATTGSCADETSIIDNFPPHEWHGAGACAKWLAALDEFMKQGGMTDGVVTVGKPKHVDITGDRAYVVIPMGFKFRMKGKPGSDPGQVTAALQKTAAGWKFTGWAWADQ